ncbi:MAG: hypothetical protein ACK41G_04120 [Candidatus Thermochlorobacter sp.]
MKNKLFFIALMFCASSTVFAQGGSLYSRFGIGELRTPMTAQMAGMGFAGSALPDPLYINRANPAMLTAIDQARISGDFTYIGYLAGTTQTSGYQVVAGFEGASLAIPIWNARVAISTGILPYSRINYKQTQRDFTVAPTTGDTVNYSFSYFGLGGLNRVPVAIGVIPFKDENWGTMRLGGAINFIFGASTQGSEQIFDTFEFVDSAINFEDRLAGTTFTLGAAYSSKQGIFTSSDQVMLGAALTTATTLRGTRQTILTKNLGNAQFQARDTLTVVDGEAKLPSSLVMAVAYKGNANYTIAADVLMQDWSSVSYFGRQNELQRNAMRIALGVEIIPSTETRSNIFSRIAYRVGSYYHQTNLQVDGIGINEWGITFGMGIPLSAESSCLDIYLHYALRGTKENNLIQENIFRIGAALNIGERWFLQRKIE